MTVDAMASNDTVNLHKVFSMFYTDKFVHSETKLRLLHKNPSHSGELKFRILRESNDALFILTPTSRRHPISSPVLAICPLCHLSNRCSIYSFVFAEIAP